MEEEEQLSAILQDIVIGTFSDISFKATLFDFLDEGSGKTIIETLLQLAAEFSTQTSYGLNSRQIRIRSTHQNIVRLLANTAGNCDFYDDTKSTVLHHASQRGWLGVVQSLLIEGADPNAKNNDQFTPLLLATEKKCKDVVNLLVESGADIFCCRDNNYTLLHSAARTGWIDFVQFLLNQGANPNAACASCTPLFIAIIFKQIDIVALLLDSGADIVCTNINMSVLHLAVGLGSLELVKYFLEIGVDVDGEGYNCLSPLCTAVRDCKIEIIECLVNAVNIKNRSNETPLKFIMRKHTKFSLCLHLIKTFIKRYGYEDKFIDDYYGVERDPSLKSDIFQNVQVCTQAIVNKFNNKDLPAFYNLPFPVGTLPPIECMMITSEGMILQDIEQSVQHEINTNQHCDLRKPKVIVLSMLVVKSYLDYYNDVMHKAQLNRSSTANSGGPSRG